jgi:hypothetical protein
MDRKTSTEKIDLKNFDPNTNRRGHRMLKKIISGGQTGADQAALDVAMKCRMITMQKELKKT